jgi:hypothetical protein
MPADTRLSPPPELHFYHTGEGEGAQLPFGSDFG